MFRSALVSPKMLMLVTKRKTLIGVCFARLSLLVDGTMSFMYGKLLFSVLRSAPFLLDRPGTLDNTVPKLNETSLWPA